MLAEAARSREKAAQAWVHGDIWRSPAERWGEEAVLYAGFSLSVEVRRAA